MSDAINIKDYPDKEEIANCVSRYNALVQSFDKVLGILEEANKNDNRWFTFSGKIGKKFLAQAFTLHHIFNYEIHLEKDGKSEHFIDFSSVDSLIRTQFETYAVFFHLFADRCDIEERIVRFRLWELDGLRTRHIFIPAGNAMFIENEKSIENCITTIRRISYFNKLDEKTREYLVKNAAWKFTEHSLRNPNKNKWKLSIDQLIMRTGLKEDMFNNLYSFASMHSHTSYWSVVQNDTLTIEEKLTTRYVALMEASFITSFFIQDLCKIFNTAKQAFFSLPDLDKEIIESFNRGRN